MASKPSNDGVPAALQQIQATLLDMQRDYHSLSRAVEVITGRVNVLSGVKELQESSPLPRSTPRAAIQEMKPSDAEDEQSETPDQPIETSIPRPRQPSLTSRIILTTYPNQAGIEPVPMNWGAKDFAIRGPVVVSHNKNTVRRRNGKSSLSDKLRPHEADGTFCSYWSPRRLVFHI